MGEMWLSKADMYQDLGVSGDINVIHNKPRQRVIDDSEDIADYLRYGSKPYRDRDQDHEQVYDYEDHVDPDLNNITSMVQMVKQAEELPSRTSPSSTKGTTQEEPIIITKSRLNPNVTEFVPGQRIRSTKCEGNSSVSPRDNSSSSQGLSSSNVSTSRSGVSPAERPSSTRPYTDNSDQDIIEDLKVHMDSIKNEDKDDIAKIIKEKYKSTKQDASKRNVAINTLMKLYTSKSPSNCSNATSSVLGQQNEVQLLKPDDFLSDTLPKKIEPTENIEEVDPYTKLVSISKVSKWLESAGNDNDSKSSSVKETAVQTTKCDESEASKKSSTISSPSSSSLKPSVSTKPSTSAKPTSTCKRYVPSKDIDKKIERLNKLQIETKKESRRYESVWDQAIDQMKALDEKKRLERLKKIKDKENSSSNCE